MNGCNLDEEGDAYQTLEGLPTHEAVMKDMELHLKVAYAAQIQKQLIQNLDPTDFPDLRFQIQPVTQSGTISWNPGTLIKGRRISKGKMYVISYGTARVNR